MRAILTTKEPTMTVMERRKADDADALRRKAFALLDKEKGGAEAALKAVLGQPELASQPQRQKAGA
jgi:hypothetical protein